MYVVNVNYREIRKEVRIDGKAPRQYVYKYTSKQNLRSAFYSYVFHMFRVKLRDT